MDQKCSPGCNIGKPKDGFHYSSILGYSVHMAGLRFSTGSIYTLEGYMSRLQGTCKDFDLALLYIQNMKYICRMLKKLRHESN